MAEADVIKEGFLCPVCHKDLRSPKNLQVHFQDVHSEDQDIIKSFKDLYGKAKKKILKLDEQDLERFKSEISIVDKYYLEYSEPQDPGHSTSHTDYFKAVRRERLDHRTAETNKLIIRLDRLLRTYGSDRKQQEQELVAWLDGSTVTRCPSCAASFNLARRQHHCRLCGSIMCNSCSYFLSYETAQTIVAPVHAVDVNEKERSPNKDSDTLRICNHCLDLLEYRRRVQIEKMIQPIIVQLYTHSQKLKCEIEASVDLYLKMYNSLTAGENAFQIHEAQSLRTAIARQAEMLDTLSKKIASLPVNEDGPKLAALQLSIRRATSHFIKDYLLTLPVPPTLQELERIKRELSFKVTYKEDLSYRSHDHGNVKKVAVTTGWSPANVPINTETNPDEDPLIDQMNIVRNYIKAAQNDQRYEEASMLRENLKMLKETYRKQQISKQDLP